MSKQVTVSVLMTPVKKEEIQQWADCEGRTMTQYFLQLHEEHAHHAKKEGLRMPVDVDTSSLVD